MLGHESARLLDQLMNGAPAPSEPILIPPLRVVSRASTDTYAISDKRVVAALEYIKREARRPLRVDEVARGAATARRALERAFRRNLNRSVAQLIALERIRLAKGLLSGTNQRVSEIGNALSFGSLEAFCRTFKRVEGVTARQFRSRLRGSDSGTDGADGS